MPTLRDEKIAVENASPALRDEKIAATVAA